MVSRAPMRYAPAQALAPKTVTNPVKAHAAWVCSCYLARYPLLRVLAPLRALPPLRALLAISPRVAATWKVTLVTVVTRVTPVTAGNSG